MRTTTKTTAKGLTLDQEVDMEAEEEDDVYQHVHKSPPLSFRTRPSKARNPARPYNLWEDLAEAKANISLGQLIQLAPSVKKQMKEGATTRRKLRSRGQAHHTEGMPAKPDKIEASKEIPESSCAGCELDSDNDFEAIQIEVEIVDKIIPNAMVDDGANVNVMPEITMRKLGLSITNPSPYSIRVADQGYCKPLGRIKGLRMRAGGVDYVLNFEIMPTKAHTGEGSFPLLLGRGFLRQSGGVADWSKKNPTFTFGPLSNRTKVLIPSKEHLWKTKAIAQTNKVLLSPTISLEQDKESTPIKCIGPGLYDFEDDGTLTNWLKEYPYSDDEPVMASVNFIEMINLPALEDDLPDLATLVDDIVEQEAFYIEIDGTQLEDWDAIIPEEVLLNQLPPPLHFRTTSEGVQVGSELPIYPPVPNDWYHGPTRPTHARPADWKEIELGIFDGEVRTIKMGTHLPDEEVAKYRDLILEFSDVMAWSYKDMKGIPPYIVQHTIPLVPNARPVRHKEKRLNPNMQLVVKAELLKLLEASFIRPVEITDWVSPMILVRKKNGKLRVCIDYRQLNKQTRKDHFPLPFVNTILDEVAGHELYTFMDGYSDYNQISIAPEDWHKTAFTTPWGTYIYVVMPFGLCNALAAFQRAMTYAFSELLHKSLTVFIDDYSTHSTEAEHLHWVRECLLCCRRSSIAVNPFKLYLAVKRGVLLGHIVSAAGTEPDPEKIEVIVNLQPPKDVKGVQKALGHIGWYRTRIEDYATPALPLTNLIKKDTKFEWTPEC